MGPDTTFFSYSRSDSDFVLKLAMDLRQAGADVWLDQLDIEAGNRWDLSIGEALKNSKKMLVILSPDSVASNNVMDEVSFALEAGKTVIPILFIPCDIPFRLRRVQHADFTKNYDDAIKNLVQTLKLGKIKPSHVEKSDSARALEEEQKAESERQEEERKLKERAELEKKYNETINRTHQNLLKRNKFKVPLIAGGVILVIVMVVWIVKSGGNDNGNQVDYSSELEYESTGLQIGQEYQGGIIFYLDADGLHGLIAAPFDQSSGIQWSTDGFYEIGGTFSNIGVGPYNTNILYTNQETGNNAAELCTDLVLNGYDDWALPSILELEQLYLRLDLIGGFYSYGYWSSTEFDSDNAYFYSFDGGQSSIGSKDQSFMVRAIRVF
ncbi:MAG: TIR domain-containing protein [Bacteroidales bacterium]|nr:TIR domain-containing protein [Bacteroidales bacterium]